ncbi:MAG: O-antigen ligase family protein [bacterium]|nr:O-antigen ligase family protein [bacterium]
MNPDKVVKYSLPLFVLTIASRSIEEISFIYYAVPVMCVLFIVICLQRVKGQRSKVKSQDGDSSLPLRMTDSLFSALNRETLLILFLIPGTWFLLTSLWSSYPDISAARALYYILISLGCLSAGILWVRYSEKNIFDFLLPANVVIVLIASFSLITNIPSDSWTGGHGKGFMGFFGHQNLLASVVLFTLPCVFHQVVILVKSRFINVESSDSRRTSFAEITEHSDSSFRRSPESEITFNYSLLNTNLPTGQAGFIPLTAYSLLLIANLLLLTLTYSRASILSLLIGVFIFLILNKSWKVLSYSFIAAVILTSTIYFTPSLNQTVDKIIKKDFPEVYSSRVWMWEPSYKAALEGGLFGLGYGISHPEIRSGEYSDRYENGRLIREKGNSSLALVEETGVVGLVLFLLPIIYAVRKFIIYNVEFRMNRNKLNNYTLYILNSSLFAFILHAEFEAWWVGVGSVQLPLFYTYLGLFTGYLLIRLE